MITILYRCDASMIGNVPYITVYKFKIIKKTEKGYWIEYLWRKKWVNSYSRKRFAYPTEQEAIISFKARKKRQLKIIERQREEVLAFLSLDEKFYLREN